MTILPPTRPFPAARLVPFCLLALLLSAGTAAFAQEPEHREAQSSSEAHAPASEAEATQHEGKEPEGKEAEEEEPATDVTLFFGSDFIRPDLVPRANLAFAVGHSFHFLRHDPLGAKLTFAYTYENTGTHGFIHTRFGEHTEQLGLLRDIKLGPHSKRFSAYTVVQAGISSLTGDQVQNRFSTSPGGGLIVHFTRSRSLWFQELYNKVETVPWYTVSSIGFTYSF